VARMMFSGAHRDAFLGLPATGKRVVTGQQVEAVG
jgi:predicted ester cyclase